MIPITNGLRDFVIKALLKNIFLKLMEEPVEVKEEAVQTNYMCNVPHVHVHRAYILQRFSVKTLY